MPTAPPPITSAPDFPALGDRVLGTYNTKAFDWATHWADVGGPEFEALGINVKANADEAFADANDADASRAAALTHASAAAAATNAPLFVGATAYATGALVYSALNGRSYRRLAASPGANATDPRDDAVRWFPLFLDVDTGLPTTRPTLYLDFVNSDVLDPRIAFARASPVNLFDRLGVLTSYAANVAPVSYDPVTLRKLGCMSVWRASTNSVANNTMVGAAAGTPGTLPTGWSVGYNGVTGVSHSVIGTGTESGITYIDIRLSGTPSASSAAGCFICFDTVTRPSASTNSVWTESAFVKVQAGAAHAGGVAYFQLSQYNSGGTLLSSIDSSAFTLAGAALNASRIDRQITASHASVASVGFSQIEIGTTAATPLDVTLRIGLPQFELGHGATPPISTSGTALARAATTATMSGANVTSWLRADEGTFTVIASTVNATGGPSTALRVDDGTDNNRIISRGESTANQNFLVVSGGATQVSTAGGNTRTPNVVYRHAIAYKANDFASSFNGGNLLSDVSGAVPIGLNRLAIGHDPTLSTDQINGHIQLLRFDPFRVSNPQHQVLSAP